MLESRVPRTDDPLLSTRRRAEYNQAEREFSLVLHDRLDKLLQGKRNNLELLRRYVGQPDRIGVMGTPVGFPCQELRAPIVEALLRDTINFVRSEDRGGPVAQYQAEDGSVVEYQTFPTKFPHIVIERIDRYAPNGAEPSEITWCLHRVQNQRAQTQINRLLDLANLGFEILRMIR